MTKEKHELDETVEDILQHYGIKGMSWGVRRTDAQIAAANNEGGGGGGGGEEEEEEGLLDDLGEMFEDFGDKLDDIGDSIKKKGKSMFDKLFKKHSTRIVPKFNKKATMELRTAMRKEQNASPAYKKRRADAAKTGKSEFKVNKTDSRGNTTRTTKTTKKGPFGIKTSSTSSIRSINTSGKNVSSRPPATRAAYEKSKTKPKTDFQKAHDAGKAAFKAESKAKEKRRKAIARITPGR